MNDTDDNPFEAEHIGGKHLGMTGSQIFMDDADGDTKHKPLTDKQIFGQYAEDRAAEYLLSLGWRIIARNVRNDYGELDIIAIDTQTTPEELVIVEVRGRAVGKLQSPIETIGTRKLRTLLRASREYTQSIDWPGFWRIDAVGLTINNKKAPGDWELEHVRDITA